MTDGEFCELFKIDKRLLNWNSYLSAPQDFRFWFNPEAGNALFKVEFFLIDKAFLFLLSQNQDDNKKTCAIYHATLEQDPGSMRAVVLADCYVARNDIATAEYYYKLGIQNAQSYTGTVKATAQASYAQFLYSEGRLHQALLQWVDSWRELRKLDLQETDAGQDYRRKIERLSKVMNLNDDQLYGFF